MHCPLILFSVLSIFAGSITPAWALSESEIRSSIQSILKIRHPNESGEWWRALGPETPRIIVALYNEDGNIYHRIRLLDALAWFDDSTATQLLKQESQNEANQVIQSAALQSLATSQGGQEQEFLSKAMNSN